MSVFNSILIASCLLLLSACQTTSIREQSASEPNKASIEQNKSSGGTNNNYPTVQESHLRMYVFTSTDQADKEQAERDGYFIDFKVKKQPDNDKTKTSD
jgi:hypothetical protein